MKSSHSFFLIQVGIKDRLSHNKTHLFRFEATWNMKEGCLNTIKEGLGKMAVGVDGASIMSKRLLNYCIALKKWNVINNKKALDDIKKKMKRLGECKNLIMLTK